MARRVESAVLPPLPVEADLALAVLDAFDEGVCVFDHDWRIVYCNPAAQAHVGLTREAALGRVYWDLIPGALGGELEAVLRRAMDTGFPEEVETASAVRPGALLAISAFPVPEGMALRFRDITERRAQAVRETAQSQRLDLAFEAAGLGDWSWDIATDEIVFSARAAAVFGLRPGPLMRWSDLLERLNPEDRETTAGAVVTAIESGGDYEVEYRVRPPGQEEERWVLSRGKVQFGEDGQPTGMIGVVADITAAKLREAAIRESEARFRLMADGAPAPIWVTTAQGQVEFVNEAFCEFAGLRPEALMGDNWALLLHPDDAPAFAAQRAQARSGQRPRPYTAVARFRGAGGAWRWMQAASRPRFDAADVFQGYVGIAMDLTEIRAADARQQLMINELNHRVKNTLATIQSIADQTARQSAGKAEFQDKFLARLMALNAAHNRLTQSAWEWTALTDLVDDQLRLHGAGDRIVADGPDLKLPPKAALSLSLALHELATNAVKYGALQGDAGQVALTWRVGEDEVEMEWRETGGPPVTTPAARGFGSRLLAAVGRDLGGEAGLEFAPEGLRWRARFRAAPER